MPVISHATLGEREQKGPLGGLCGDSCCITSQSITGRADDNHHDIHSWMLEASSGQLLGHVDDGEE